VRNVISIVDADPDLAELLDEDEVDRARRDATRSRASSTYRPANGTPPPRARPTSTTAAF